MGGPPDGIPILGFHGTGGSRLFHYKTRGQLDLRSATTNRQGRIALTGAKHPPAARRVLTALRRWGILLECDQKLPSIATLIAGTPIPRSWWAHPEAHAIYSAIRHLRSNPDVVTTRLVSGKITYVHRRLWGALLAAARSHEVWQLGALSPEAKALFEMVCSKGVVQTDHLSLRRGPTGKTAGEAARELEKKLLVHSTEIHTRKGFHAKRLETWTRWARGAGFLVSNVTPASGRRKLENVVQRLPRQNRIRLPWHAAAR